MGRPTRIRTVCTTLFFGLAAIALASAASAQPSFSKAFTPSTIGPGSVSTLRFEIDNAAGTPITDLAFVDILPAAVTVATPASATSTCGGTVTAPEGGSTVTFTDGDVGAFSTCVVQVDVTSTTPGVHMNVSGDLTSSAGSSGSANADLTVATDRPGFSKSFSPATASLGDRVTLTFTIDNSLNASLATNLVFVDNLPAGLVVADPANAVNTCVTVPFTGGRVAAVPGTGTIQLSLGGGLDAAAVAAGGTCTISVDLVTAAVGDLDNVTGELTSTIGSTTLSSGKASARLTVDASTVSLTKSFLQDPVPPGGTVELEFTLRNLDRTETASGITLSDDLDATLAGLTATGPLPTDPCGTGSTLSGSSVLTLTGGSLAPEASCSFAVTLAVPAAATPGVYPNTTSTVAYDLGGSPGVGSAATDSLFVFAAPRLEKAFLDSPVSAGSSTRMEFTVTNTSATSGATDITLLDELTTFLPFPISATVPPNACGGSLSLISLGTDSQGLLLTGGSLAAGASCTFEVLLDLPLDLPTGTYTNTTGEISATVDGATVVGNPASADFDVVAAPRLTKSFVDDPVAPGGTVTLELTLEHSLNAPADATDIAFSDDLDAALSGLTAVGLPAGDVCGTGSQISGTSTLSFTGGTLVPGASCTFSVILQVPAGTAGGSFENTTSEVTATVGGLAVSTIGAQDTLVVSPLTFTKEFVDDPVLPGAMATLTFTLTNAGSSDATNIFFTDSLSATLSGLTAIAPLPTTPCGAGSSITGTTFLIFTGGTLPAGSSCTFSVDLQVPPAAADGTYGNTTSSLSADVPSTVVLPPATDVLTVSSQPLLVGKSFIDDPVVPGGMVSLELTIENAGSQTVTDIALTDDLDATLGGLVATGLPATDVCGIGSTLTGTSLLALSGGSLAPGSSCTVSVTLQVPAGAAGGTYPNTTSTASGTVGGVGVSGNAASDDLTVSELQFTKSFADPAAPGGTVVLSYQLSNLSSSAVSALSFTDDLAAVLPGLVATGLPLADPCGPGSQLTGTSFLALAGGSVGAGLSCSFEIVLQVPPDAPVGSWPSTSSDLVSGGLVVATPALDTLTVSPVPTFTKSFSPEEIEVGEITLLRFEIDNSGGVVDVGSLSFVDDLPSGLLVADPANAGTTCVGGTLTAVAGSAAISYTGGTVPAGTLCTVSVDVTVDRNLPIVNTVELATEIGTSAPSTATLNGAVPIPVTDRQGLVVLVLLLGLFAVRRLQA